MSVPVRCLNSTAICVACLVSQSKPFARLRQKPVSGPLVIVSGKIRREDLACLVERFRLDELVRKSELRKRVRRILRQHRAKRVNSIR